MQKNTIKWINIVLILFCFSSLSLIYIPILTVNAGTQTEANKQLEQELFQRFKKYVEIINAGDVDSFRKMRENSKVRELEQILVKRGKKITSKAITPRRPEILLEVLSCQVIGCKRTGDWARLEILRIQGEFLEPSEVEVFFVLFKNEDSEWKIYQFGPQVYKKGEIKEDAPVPDKDVPEMFKIPQGYYDL